MTQPFLLSPFTALALALSATACAGPQSRAETPRGEGAGWSEVTTEHFALRTDLGASDAAAAALQLESTYSALAELGFASTDRPKAMIDVVYFKRHEDYATVRPQATAGQFLANGIHDFERRPTAVLGGDFVESTRRVLQHELTHMFVHYYYPRAPIWLNEGLARYLETLSIDDGRAVLGRAPREARFWKGPWKVTSERGWSTVALIPVDEAPAVSALRAMNGSFYVDLHADTQTAHGRDVARAMASHYQAAWCLVHLLLEDAAYTKAFGDYLARLHAGDGDQAAWRATLGAVPSDELEADYRASLVPREVTTLRATVTPPKMEPPAVSELTPREVRVLWARLRDWGNAEARGAAARELDGLEATDATDLGVDEATTLASWLVAERKPADAKQVVESALKRHPGDARLLNALGWMLFEEMRERARTGAKGSVQDDARLTEIARELQAKGESAPELDLAARVVALRGATDDAIALEERAYRSDPSCGPCLVISAELLAEKHRYKEALDVEMLAFSPDAPIPPSVTEKIERWRQLAAGAGEASEAPSPTPATGAAVAVPHADAVLAAMRPKFRACFGVGPKPAAGSVEFDVRVGVNGAVTGAAARSGATFPPSVVECLGGILKGAHFPAPGDDASLRVPIAVGGS